MGNIVFSCKRLRFRGYITVLLSALLILSSISGILGIFVAAQEKSLTAADSHVIYADTFDGTQLDSSKWVWAGEKEKPQYTAEVVDGKLRLNNADAGGSGVAGLRYVKDADRVEQRASVEFVSYAGLKPQLWLRVAQKWLNAYSSVSGYFVNFNCNAGGWTEVKIQKRNDNYVTTDLAFGKFSATDGETYRLEVSAQGTSPTLITAYVYKITGSGEQVVAITSAVDYEPCLQDAGTAGVSYLRSSSVTTQTTVIVDNFEYTSTDDVAGKYYVEEGTAGSKTFGQVVVLDPTKRYIFAAHAVDNGLRNGEDVNPLWIEYFNTNNSYTRVLTARSELKSNRREADVADGIEYNEYFTVFYDKFDLSACADKKVESNLGNKTRVIVGFRCDGSTVTAGKFSHFTLYAADDPDKTNLLVNPDLKMGFYGWNDAADSYMSYTQMKESVTTAANGYVTFVSVSDDEYNSVFINKDYTSSTTTEKNYMLKGTGNGDANIFGQIVKLNEDTEYIYSVKAKADALLGSKPGVWYLNTNNEYVPIQEKLIAYESVSDYTTVYSFKASASDIAKQNGTVTFLVGCSLGVADSEGYYSDFILYRKDDAKKTNILINSDFQSGLKGWTASCYEGFAPIEENSVTVTADGCSVIVEQTDPNYFIRNDLPNKKIVIHNNGQASYGKVGNIVYLDPSKTYVYGVSYLYVDQQFSKPFIQYQNINGAFTNYDPDSVALKVTADSNFFRNEYEFNVPAEAKIETDGTVKMKIGYTSGGTGADVYFGDFVLYEKDDNTHTNLLVNSDFTEGLKGWSDGGTPITTDSQYSLFGADLVAVEDDFFAIPTVEKLTGHWVVHNTGKVEYAKFGQIVELDPSKTYVYEVSYLYKDQKGSMPFMRYLSSNGYTNYTDYISTAQDDEYYRETYTFKVPQKASVQANGKAKMQIGITCGMAGADAYFGDFVLYEKGDAAKTNLFTNADFAFGLYGWTSNGYNNLPITDYGIMQTKQGDVELVKVTDDYFKRPVFEKLTGHWVVHNTGKVEYAKFGQIVELDPSKTYVYEVSYLYKDQKGSMPFMRYLSGNSYVNYTDYISTAQDDEYYRETYTFKVPQKASIQANGKAKMQIGITCGMAGADAYFGDFVLYEKDDAAKTNLFTNADFAFGLYGWTSNGYNNLPITDYGIMQTKQGDVELVKATDDYFKRPPFERFTKEPMLHVTGKWSYAHPGQIVELTPGETYCYSMYEKYFAQNGCKPLVFVKKQGSYTTFVKQLDIASQDEMHCFTVYRFTVPKDVDVNVNGKSEVLVGLTTGITGADAYFYDFQLYLEKDSAKTNLFVNPDFEYGLYGWTGTGYNYKPETDYGVKIFRYKNEAELLPYDAAIFVNDLSDAFFDDGNWAEKFGEDYTMMAWLEKLGLSAKGASAGQTEVSENSNAGKLTVIIVSAVGAALILSTITVVIVLFVKRKKKR